jgi:hypothetical protein
MVEYKSSTDATVLRQRVSRFLGRRSRLKAPLVEALLRIADMGLPAVIFGGALRDLMLVGPTAEPRDVDIVVDGASTQELEKIYSDLMVRRTRFGGLHLNAKGWMIDVWPLSETWAFREHRAGNRDFEALPRTTFLNIEGITIDLKAQKKPRRVHSSGFFEAVRNEVLDINLEENPFPELALIRTLITASKLHYSLSTRLAKYVLHYADRTPFEELTSIQLSHYGHVKCGTDSIHSWISTIKCQVGTGAAISGPERAPFQMTLPYMSKLALANDKHPEASTA